VTINHVNPEKNISQVVSEGVETIGISGDSV
jgi:hypothetical protein